MERDLALTVLDHELVDEDGERCGRVDDIELEISGSRCVPKAVVVGRASMRRRLGNGLFGRVIEGLVPVANHWVAWDDVIDVTHVVKLRNTAGSYGLARSDARLEPHLKRIPGG